MNAKTFTFGAGKQHLTFTALRLSQPGLQDCKCGFGDWRTAFLAALSDHVHVSAGSPEDEILTFEPGHLGQAQTGLYCDQDKGVITPARPGTLIWSGQQGIDFGTCERFDQGPREALARYGERPLNLCGVRRRLEGRIAKEGMDCGEAQIAAANADASALLEVIQK